LKAPLSPLILNNFAKMEMKIIAAHLLRSYDWEILPNQSLDTMGIPNRPKDGLWVQFKAR
jgi:retinoid hydroxylase